jgi:hypothetical protein
LNLLGKISLRTSSGIPSLDFFISFCPNLVVQISLSLGSYAEAP